MERTYNYIYRSLVTSDNDIVGQVAYAIYKQTKVDYIQTLTEKQGFPPTPEQIEIFHIMSATPIQIEMYRERALANLKAVLFNTMNEQIEEIKQELQKDNINQIQQAVKPLATPWWKNVLWGILSAFVFALIVAAFAFIKNYSASDINIDFNSKTEQPNPQKSYE